MFPTPVTGWYGVEAAPENWKATEPMADFRIDGKRLRVGGRLGEEDEEQLRKCCLDLFLTGAAAVEIDMTGVEEACSRCIGVLATLWIDLSVVGRRFKLIPSPKVARLLDMSGLSRVFLADGAEPPSGNRRTA